MTEGTQPNPDTSSGDGTTAPSVVSGATTVEEADAYWKTRQSGLQLAHNAEVESLRRQMDALRQQNSTPPGTPVDPNAAEVQRLQAELAAERLANGYRSKYPAAADVLGDEITKLAEEKIAAINAGFSQQTSVQPPPPPAGGPPIIDPNSPPRTPGGGPVGPKRPEDMDIEESKDALRALTPAYQAMIAER